MLCIRIGKFLLKMSFNLIFFSFTSCDTESILINSVVPLRMFIQEASSYLSNPAISKGITIGY